MKNIRLTKTIVKMVELTDEQYKEFIELEEDFEKEEYVEWNDCVWNEFDDNLVFEEE